MFLQKTTQSHQRKYSNMCRNRLRFARSSPPHWNETMSYLVPVNTICYRETLGAANSASCTTRILVRYHSALCIFWFASLWTGSCALRFTRHSVFEHTRTTAQLCCQVPRSRLLRGTWQTSTCPLKLCTRMPGPLCGPWHPFYHCTAL